MVDFIVNDLNLDPLLELMHGQNKEFGREMLIPTLQATDALQGFSIFLDEVESFV